MHRPFGPEGRVVILDNARRKSRHVSNKYHVRAFKHLNKKCYTEKHNFMTTAPHLPEPTGHSSSCLSVFACLQSFSLSCFGGSPPLCFGSFVTVALLCNERFERRAVGYWSCMAVLSLT